MKFLFVFIALVFSSVANSKTPVSLYTYLDKPPYSINRPKEKGLSFELANALNKISKNYHYRIEYMPKQRGLNELKKSGAMLWVNPIWLDDTKLDKYLWYKNIFTERELYITNKLDFSYQKESSLYDKILVGVRGYKYFNLTKLLDNKKLRRIDVPNEKLVLEMLMRNRGDFGVFSSYTFTYLAKDKPSYKSKMKVIEGYKQYFTRGIAISKNNPKVLNDFEALFQSDLWHELEQKWLLPM